MLAAESLNRGRPVERAARIVRSGTMDFFASVDLFVDCAPDNAGVGDFGVPDFASFVNVFARQSSFGCGRRDNTVLVWNGFGAPLLPDFSALLCRVIFIGEPALRQRFDFERVGLGAIEDVVAEIDEMAPGSEAARTLQKARGLEIHS
jgi:hypothetical protein